MIEMRVIDNGPMCRPDFQYRYTLPRDERYYELVEWSDWETAEWVNAKEIEND